MASSASSSSSSTFSAESFLGSYICLTSKMEIQYKGEVVSLDTKEFTIALKNVRSFGTQGRRKDGPQVPADNRLYDYIQFRGSDIKDIKVLSLAEALPKPQMPDDPAIIQSAGSLGGSSSVTVSLGSLPPIDPISTIVSSALSLPSNSDALEKSVAGPAAPDSTSVVWPGHHGGLTGPSQTYQQSEFFQSSVTPVACADQSLLNYPISMPHGNATFPNYSSFPAALTLTDPQFATSNPTDAAQHSTNLSPSLKPNCADVHLMSGHGYLLPQPVSSSSYYQQAIPPSASNQVNPENFPASLAHNQLTHSGTITNTDTQKYIVESKGRNALLLTPSESFTSTKIQSTLLPLPPSVEQPQKSTMQFNEEFDFSAMNEKFNKDEIWGTLGKGKNEAKMGQVTRGSVARPNIVQKCPSDNCEEIVKKPSYNKDDFFDTISRNSLGLGKSKFSERMKLDTQTFGDFPRNPSVGRGRGRGRRRGGYQDEIGVHSCRIGYPRG